MPDYIIIEVARYRVPAESPDEAAEKFLGADNVDEYFMQVDDREMIQDDTGVLVEVAEEGF